MKYLELIVVVTFIFLLNGACNNKSSNEKVVSTTQIDNGIATSTFKVWGNCGMCKNTIEGSLKTEGVKNADWNVDTKVMTVVYDTSKISLDMIKRNISHVGYDNDVYTASDHA